MGLALFPCRIRRYSFLAYGSRRACHRQLDLDSNFRFVPRLTRARIAALGPDEDRGLGGLCARFCGSWWGRVLGGRACRGLPPLRRYFSARRRPPAPPADAAARRLRRRVPRPGTARNSARRSGSIRRRRAAGSRLGHGHFRLDVPSHHCWIHGTPRPPRPKRDHQNGPQQTHAHPRRRPRSRGAVCRCRRRARFSFSSSSGIGGARFARGRGRPRIFLRRRSAPA
mmetsp:Transcript_805/g.2898  ORF Transcript_805/g.2898 Transcript_805/m.2898 type:complete len:226 (-) Transcript_805:1147-1824(-)